MRNYLSKINPFHKFISVLVLAILLAFSSSIAINVTTIVVCIILIATGSKKLLSALKLSIPIILMAIALYITGADYGGLREYGILLSTRIIAFFTLAMVFSLTTEPYDFMQSLQKDAKLPRKFAYGILCAFNLLPHMKNEYNNARLALAVRGVRMSVFNIKPIFSTMVNSVRWSEMLSIAMQSKGFNED